MCVCNHTNVHTVDITAYSHAWIRASILLLISNCKMASYIRTSVKKSGQTLWWDWTGGPKSGRLRPAVFDMHTG